MCTVEWDTMALENHSTVHSCGEFRKFFNRSMFSQRTRWYFHVFRLNFSRIDSTTGWSGSNNKQYWLKGAFSFHLLLVTVDFTVAVRCFYTHCYTHCYTQCYTHYCSRRYTTVRLKCSIQKLPLFECRPSKQLLKQQYT